MIPADLKKLQVMWSTNEAYVCNQRLNADVHKDQISLVFVCGCYMESQCLDVKREATTFSILLFFFLLLF